MLSLKAEAQKAQPSQRAPSIVPSTLYILGHKGRLCWVWREWKAVRALGYLQGCHLLLKTRRPPIPLPLPPASSPLSLRSLCHIFLATWCHLTREVALRSPARAGSLPSAGELDAVTAASSLRSLAGPWN